jgi:flagellar biosynthesis/type III secretory pathway M-ring protein FliF/YscJ
MSSLYQHLDQQLNLQNTEFLHVKSLRDIESKNSYHIDTNFIDLSLSIICLLMVFIIIPFTIYSTIKYFKNKEKIEKIEKIMKIKDNLNK